MPDRWHDRTGNRDRRALPVSACLSRSIRRWSRRAAGSPRPAMTSPSPISWWTPMSESSGRRALPRHTDLSNLRRPPCVVPPNASLPTDTSEASAAHDVGKPLGDGGQSVHRPPVEATPQGATLRLTPAGVDGGCDERVGLRPCRACDQAVSRRQGRRDPDVQHARSDLRRGMRRNVRKPRTEGGTWS